MIVDILNKMNIHDLRTTARLVGVKSPTTKRASELIEEIVLIKNKKMEPFKSNMGRPPKIPKKNKLIQYILDSFLYENNYEPINKAPELDFCLRAPDDLVGLNNSNNEDFIGIVRELDNDKYIKNYFKDNSYCLFEDDRENLVDAGDIIFGKYENDDLFGKITSFEKKEFNKSDNIGEAFVKECDSSEEMYNYVLSQGGTKIVVEVEAELNRNKTNNDNNVIYFSTKECADIKDSYNLLLDIKQLVNNLCKNGKEFSLYFIDVEYIYSILGIYYEVINQSADLNAGQYFKEILSKIKNSKGSNVTLLQKELGKRSSYFDVIINRYCKKI